jgi:predicted CXXCH cytochrome family protein
MAMEIQVSLAEIDAAPPPDFGRQRLVMLSALLAATLGSASAQDVKPAGAGQRPGDRTLKDYSKDCLRSGCHAGLNATPKVHAPVALGACESCHQPSGEAAAHNFQPTRPEKEACGFCHRAPAKKHLHQAYAEGKCTGCHDPHGGKTSALLVTEDTAALCGRCHDARSEGSKLAGAPGAGPAHSHLHSPVQEGKCLDCHAAHASDHLALRTLPERELCLKCHEPVLAGLRAAAHVHEPLATECGSCHQAHGGGDRLCLRGATNELCASCHAKDLTADGGKVPHNPLREGGSCLDCHAGHTSPEDKLLREGHGARCLECHDRELPRAAGGLVKEMKAHLAAAKFPHQPAASGECQVCHRAHPSPHPDLLRHTYPTTLYAALGDSTYDLCFDCHDDRLATAERTTATAFRQGDRNLHHVHVSGQKGRTCGLCHDPHATDLPAMLRSSVRFGPRGWELPIGFERTETGGSCASGCHQKLRYDNREPRGEPARASSGKRPPQE